MGWCYLRVSGLLQTVLGIVVVLIGSTIWVEFVGPLLFPPEAPVGASAALAPQAQSRGQGLDLDRILGTAMSLVALVFLPRLGFGLRAYMRGASQMTGQHFQQALPLPSQWDAIESMIQSCGGQALERTPFEGKIVTLDSKWGTGKTYTVRSFERLSNADPGVFSAAPGAGWISALPSPLRCLLRGVLDADWTSRSDGSRPINLVVSYYNAWQHQMEPDLEYAIIRHLVSDRRVMWPYGWIVIPAWRMIATSLLQAVGLGGGYKLRLFSVAVESNRAPAPLKINWTDTVTRIAWCTWKRSPGGRKNATLVLVIDDVDRCQPLVAQRYVTLLRRGLTLPNLAVVMPYTPDQLRYKVFDPLSVDLPDLGSSMEAAHAAMLFGIKEQRATAPRYVDLDAARNAARSMGVDSPFRIGAKGSGEDLLKGLSADFDRLRENRLGGITEDVQRLNDGSSVIDANWNAALNIWELLRRERLNQSYVEMMLLDGTAAGPHDSATRRLIRQLESKYVSDANVRFPSLSYRDIVQVLMHLPSVQKTVFGLSDPGPQPQHGDAVAGGLMYCVCRHANASLKKYGPYIGANTLSIARPDAVDDGLVSRIEADLTFDALFRRVNAKEIDFLERAKQGHAPSIRTIIASTDRLVQSADFSNIFEFANEKFPPVPTAVDENRYDSVLSAFDWIVVEAFNYAVE